MIRLILFITIVSCSTVVLAAETHVVTATGNRWIYRNSRSGVGETEAVQINAKPGDFIEFRQTGGTHGVIFYRNPLGVSELGKAVDVDRDITYQGKLQRLSTSRLFSQENLATPETNGVAGIITIQLADDFQGPLYFADRVKSIRGQNLMFGVIRKSTAEAVEALVIPPDYSIRRTSRVLSAGRIDWDENRTLGNLDAIKVRQVFRSPKRGEIPDLEKPEEKAKWPLAGWFGGRLVADKGLSPFDDRVTWRFATSADLDGDSDLDVIALIESEGKPMRWWALINGVRTNPQKPGIPRDLLGSLKAFTTAIPVATLSKDHDLSTSFAIVSDFNGDSMPDLVFHNGGDGQLHFSYQKSSLVSPGYEFSEPQTLDTEIVFGLASLRAAYPVDANSDGWSDLLVAGDKLSLVFLNRPGRGFSSTDAQKFPVSGSAIRRIGQDDLNHDQRFELIIEDREGQVSVYDSLENGRYKAVEKGK